MSGRCLEGVLGCLCDSRYCLEDDSAKSIDKIPIRRYLFSQLPPVGQKCRKIQKVIWLWNDFLLVESMWSCRQNTLYLPLYQVWRVMGLGFDFQWSPLDYPTPTHPDMGNVYRSSYGGSLEADIRRLQHYNFRPFLQQIVLLNDCNSRALCGRLLC